MNELIEEVEKIQYLWERKYPPVIGWQSFAPQKALSAAWGALKKNDAYASHEAYISANAARWAGSSAIMDADFEGNGRVAGELRAASAAAYAAAYVARAAQEKADGKKWGYKKYLRLCKAELAEAKKQELKACFWEKKHAEFKAREWVKFMEWWEKRKKQEEK